MSLHVGIYATVYRPAHWKQAHLALPQLTAQHSMLWVPTPRGNVDREEAGIRILNPRAAGTAGRVFSPPDPPVELEELDVQLIGPMFGGCFVFSSDGRFQAAYGPHPVPVHDRWDTAEHYQLLST